MGLRRIADEVISVSSGSTFTLTRDTYDNTGSGRAEWAEIHNHDLGANTTVALRVGEAPDLAAYEFKPLLKGETLTIDGYDNLRDLQIKLSSSATATAKLFVEYFM